MTRPSYRDLLEARWARGRFVCIGLDPDLSRIPAHLKTGSDAAAVVSFCTAVAAATHDLACAFKPNAAFFEALGPEGLRALGEIVARLREIAPEVPVIYDAKRGDIGSTNAGYVADAFDRLGADAITVHPYLGEEALRPFLDRTDRGTIVLCRTSNPGAGEFQDLAVDGQPLYLAVAERVARWDGGRGHCSLVVGATYPEELKAVRARVGTVPILVPGIGAQGGDLARAVEAGRDGRGRGLVVSASRAVLYASDGPDFAEAARREALRLHDEITRCLDAARVGESGERPGNTA